MPKEFMRIGRRTSGNGRGPAFGRWGASSVLLLLLNGGSPGDVLASAPYLGVAPQGDARHGGAISKVCAGCHGEDGNSVSAKYPNLAAQSYNYLLKQLEDFRSGARKAMPMAAEVKTVHAERGDKDLQALAAYFASQSLNRNEGANARVRKPPKALARQGYQIYVTGDRADKVPPCSACHMPSGMGNAPMAVPALAGQHARYVEAELERFASGKRRNSPHHIMEEIARRLNARQIKAVAVYVQALHPQLAPGMGPHGYQTYVNGAGRHSVPGIPEGALKNAKSGVAASGGRK